MVIKIASRITITLLFINMLVMLNTNLVAAVSDIKNPDTLVVATIGEPETLDPAWLYDTASAEVVFNIYETLIFFDGNRTNKFVPMLATEVPTVENGLISPDGLTYIFPIRTGITFSNGNPLTPEDIEYSFERTLVQDRDGGPVWMLLEPLLNVFSTRGVDGNIVVSFADIDNAVESNATHVTFHLATPYPPFMQILAQSWSSIVDKEWAIAQGDWPGTEATWQTYNNPVVPPLQEVAMGTGPFKLERWDHGVEVVLVRNDNYWRTPAKLGRVIIKKIDEWSTRKLLFEAGDVDLAYVPRQYVQEMEGVEGIRYYKDLPTLIIHAYFFTFNISADSPHIWSGQLDGNGIPPDFFADKHVRLGFAHAFDWDTFIDDVWLGEATQPASPVIEGLPFVNPAQEKFSFNLTAATEHFKMAYGGNLTTGPVWENGFTITLLYNIGNVQRKTAMEILKANVESLNPKFNILVKGVEWPTFLSDMVDSKLPIFMVGWLADYPDPHNFVQPFMHSNGAFSLWQRYSNNTVDALIEEGIRTNNATRRQEIYYKLQKIYHEDAPSVPTEQPLGRHYERDWVQGWYYNPIFPGTYFYPISKLERPIAFFTYSPQDPHINETVTFDASASYDPDGTIISYIWDFGDGSQGNGNITTHVYAVGGSYTITLTVIDNSNLNSTFTTEITVFRITALSLDIEVEVGSIHFRGEIAEFYIMVSSLGSPVDANMNAILYYDGAFFENLTDDVERVTAGFYRIPYTVPTNASSGTYALVAEANYLSLKGVSIESFLSSPTLTGWNALLININGTVGILKTDLGLIKVKLDAINAMLVSIEGRIVTIESDLGTIKTDINSINGRLTSIEGDVATIATDMGTINGTVTSIQGTIATIETDIGTIKTMLEGWTGGATSLIVTPEGVFQILVLTTSALEGPIEFSDNVVAITLSGPSGTAGVTNIVIPKRLLVGIESSIDEVVVTVDDKQVVFTYTEQSEAYVLTITYTHSTRTMKIYLTGLPPTPVPWALYVIATAIIVLAVSALLAIYILKIRKPRVAKTK